MNCYNVKERVTSREKRNPLLDRVKNTKLSCFRSDMLKVPAADSSELLNEVFAVSHTNDNVVYYGRHRTQETSCLSAKLRAMSEKYLKSSTSTYCPLYLITLTIYDLKRPRGKESTGYHNK